MLVLKRTAKDGTNTVRIANGLIVVKILSVSKNGAVKLGIDAPTDIPVHREELEEASEQLEKASAT